MIPHDDKKGKWVERFLRVFLISSFFFPPYFENFLYTCNVVKKLRSQFLAIGPIC